MAGQKSGSGVRLGRDLWAVVRILAFILSETEAVEGCEQRRDEI